MSLSKTKLYAPESGLLPTRAELEKQIDEAIKRAEKAEAERDAAIKRLASFEAENDALNRDIDRQRTAIAETRAERDAALRFKVTEEQLERKT